MYSVGVSIDGNTIIKLPCPLRDLMRVCELHVASAPHQAGPNFPCHNTLSPELQRDWRKLISVSPTLLWLVISHFSLAPDHRPAHDDQLLLWCRANLANCLLAPKVIRKWKPSDPSSNGLASAWERYRATRSKKKIHAALIDYLLAGLPKKKSRSLKSTRKLAQALISSSTIKSLHKLRRNQWEGELPALEHSLKRGNSADVTCKTIRALLASAVENTKSTHQFEIRLQLEKLDAMKQLAYGASHEINNPLANIATGSQVLLASETDCDRKYRLSRIYAQAMAAHEMISDLMLFAHPPAPVFRQVNLRILINGLINRRPSTAPPINAVFGPSVETAEIDETQIAIVLDALLKNAVQSIKEKKALCQSESVPFEGRIQLRVERAGSDILARLTDNGVGLTEQNRKHLFDPFYSGREAGRGLGFGLSKAWRIAQLHCGQLDYARDDRSDETTFILRFPIQTPRR